MTLNDAANILAVFVLVAMVGDQIMTRRRDRLAKELQSVKPAATSTPPPDCNHDPVPIDARPLKSEALAYPHTVVLRRCSRCGVHVVITYPGEWEIGDFLKKQSDVSVLEGMMLK
jgi:hypothetical protein